jgi:tetratricopeptide (TPR) repeat protein
MRASLALVLIVFGLVTALPARADDWADCQSDSAATSIAGCTAIIAANKETKRDLATAYFNRGLSHNDNKDYDLAIPDFDEAIKLFPKYAKAFNSRGLAHYNKDDLESAIADYTQSIAIDDTNARAFNNRGNAYSQKSDYDSAIADYDRAIALDDAYENAFYNRGLARNKKGNFDGAVSDFTRSLELAPNEGLTFYNRAKAHEGKNEWQLAVDDWQSAIANLAENEEARGDAVTYLATAEEMRNQQNATQTPITPNGAGARIALVIGNSAYQHAGALSNPGNDAKLMTETLEKVGFKVTTLIDADQLAMKKAMLEFGRQLRGGADASLFYYSGHGLQVKSENYLIPVDASIADEGEVDLQAVGVNSFLQTMDSSPAKVKIVVLDACRNNPFASSFRSLSRGLATVDAPTGTYIAYSTAPGNVAEDGVGNNSTYTAALAESILQPGLTIEQAFKKTRIQVLTVSDQKQVPWESSSLTGDFYFSPAK